MKWKVPKHSKIVWDNLLCVLLLAIGGIPAYADGPKIDLTGGLGMLRGNTTYEIRGSEERRFPVSKLEFPLDVYMASVKGNIEFAKKWNLSMGIKKNITSDAGKAKDSDWGFNYYEIEWWLDQDSFDVYSESEADLEALIMDINLRYYRLYEKSKGSLFAGIGYIRQNFGYEVNNLDEWYPSLNDYLNDYYGYEVGHTYISGKILTYEVTYSIPYMEIGAQLKIKDKVRAEASLGYSPIVKATDKDEHLLRSRTSRGDCDGNVILLSLEGRYDIRESWFLTLELDCIGTATDGRLKSYFENKNDHTVDQKIESEQTFGTFAVKYAF